MSFVSNMMSFVSNVMDFPAHLAALLLCAPTRSVMLQAAMRGTHNVGLGRLVSVPGTHPRHHAALRWGPSCKHREIYQSPACIYKAERDLSIAGMYVQNRQHIHVPSTALASRPFLPTAVLSCKIHRF